MLTEARIIDLHTKVFSRVRFPDGTPEARVYML